MLVILLSCKQFSYFFSIYAIPDIKDIYSAGTKVADPRCQRIEITLSKTDKANIVIKWNAPRKSNKRNALRKSNKWNAPLSRTNGTHPVSITNGTQHVSRTNGTHIEQMEDIP